MGCVVRGVKQQLDIAYRERAGMIAALCSCICMWPLIRYETATEHHERCCAVAFLSSRDPSTTNSLQTLAYVRRDEIAKFHAGGG